MIKSRDGFPINLNMILQIVIGVTVVASCADVPSRSNVKAFVDAKSINPNSDGTFQVECYNGTIETRTNEEIFSDQVCLGKAAVSCPEGYTFVPGDADYGNKSFCVMKYEAKQVDNKASSKAQGAPWQLTQNEARAACNSLGTNYGLINNSEWMTLASNLTAQSKNWTGGTIGAGLLIRGYSKSVNGDELCPASTDDKPFVESVCNPIASKTEPEQRRTHVLSNGELVWDLAGNGTEWVDYNNAIDKPTLRSTGSFVRDEFPNIVESSTLKMKDLIPIEKTWWNPSWNTTNGIGFYEGGMYNSGGAMRRGGGYQNFYFAGLFYTNMYGTADSEKSAFRCVMRVR